MTTEDIGFVLVLAGGLAALWLMGWIRPRRVTAASTTLSARLSVRDVVERMTRLAEPTLLLRHGPDSGFCRLGGAANLPSGSTAPAAIRGKTRFLAQLDLAALRESGGPAWMPETGALYMFLVDDLGSERAISVIHAPPGEMSGSSGGGIVLSRLTSTPSLDWLGITQTPQGPRKDWAEVATLAAGWPNGAPLHRVGGFPDEIQPENMALLCAHAGRADSAYSAIEQEEAVNAWRLLLQLDSDEALDWNWGDGGRLFVFVKKEDAGAGDFSKTVTLYQTY